MSRNDYDMEFIYNFSFSIASAMLILLIVLAAGNGGTLPEEGGVGLVTFIFMFICIISCIVFGAVNLLGFVLKYRGSGVNKV